MYPIRHCGVPPHCKEMVATLAANGSYLYSVVCVLCAAHKVNAVNARVNFDLQTQAEVDRQYRALGELVNIQSFYLCFFF